MAMSDSDFEFIAAILKERSGLTLQASRAYLIEARLTPIARRRGMEGLPNLVSALRKKADEQLLVEITEAMMTNETFFFRDNIPFDVTRDQLIPYLRRARSGTRKLRIWCAAASTGQEPYSLAMQFAEQPDLWAGWTIDILGTDISADALTRAKTGVYSQFEVQRGLPIQLLIKYFTQDRTGWVLSEDIRKRVALKQMNLFDVKPDIGRFDIIFCRNVLIYFEAEGKRQVLDTLHRHLADDGALFLGAAETVLGLSAAFKPVRELRGLYIPVASPMADELVPAAKVA